MSKIIGIDLGTGNSAVSIVENGSPVVIINDSGDRTTPSIVSYNKDEILVGKTAKNRAVTNPKNTVYAIKRFMGNKYSDMSDWINIVPYDVVEGPNGTAKVSIDGVQHSPEEISAQILMKMKKIAEDYIGEPVTEAVITVPAYFNDTQRQATKDAGRIAGLEVKRLVAEPTAAALAFGYSDTDMEKKVVVFDTGSGTVDCSILDIADGVFEVLATSGDTHLGGTDFDNAIVNWLCDNFESENGVDLRKDPMALQRIKEAAEQAKIALSSSTSTSINLPYITATSDGPKHMVYDLTRAKFDQLTENLVERHRTPILKAMKDAGLNVSDIDDILLVGGTTRIPAIQKLVKDIFGKEGNKSVNPDEAVAIGAAIQGSILAGEKKDILLLDVTPLSLGIETNGGVCTKVIERNTTIPTAKKQVFTTATDGQTAVTIHVLQGERQMARDNRTLGMFNLDGIAPAPRGVPQIEVSFDVNADGLVIVSAKDLGTGKEQHITITGNSNLSDSEIEKMVKEAEAHSEEDKKIREKIELKNQAESLVYSTEKSLKDYGDKLSEEDKAKVEEAIKDVKDNLESDNLKEKFENLQSASMIIGQKIYESQSSGGNTNFADDIFKAAERGTSGTEDAEFTEV